MTNGTIYIAKHLLLYIFHWIWMQWARSFECFWAYFFLQVYRKSKTENVRMYYLEDLDFIHTWHMGGMALLIWCDVIGAPRWACSWNMWISNGSVKYFWFLDVLTFMVDLTFSRLIVFLPATHTNTHSIYLPLHSSRKPLLIQRF